MHKLDQVKTVDKIKRQGMTVTGWARTRGFSVHTVKNILYRDGGDDGPVARQIIKKLRDEGLM